LQNIENSVTSSPPTFSRRDLLSAGAQDANGVDSFYPLSRCQHKAVETGPVSKPLEFEGFKRRIVQMLPYAEKFNGIPAERLKRDSRVRGSPEGRSKAAQV
jgi:hypothetical protein